MNRPWRSSAAAFGLTLAVVFAAGCRTPVDADELPDSAIAVMYWSVEDARRRLESRERSGPRKRGVARLQDIGSLLGVPTDDPGSVARRYPSRLGLVDPRSGAVSRVESAPPGAVPLAWSADHQRLLFAASRAARPWQIYEYDLRSGEVRRLTHDARAHLRGDYGPQGDLVHTSLGLEGVEGLVLSVTPAAGGEPRVLVQGLPVEEVRWSPRGDMLVIVIPELARSGRSGSPLWTLFALKSDGSSEKRPLGRGRDPAFSSDGEWLVYSAPVGDGWRLRRMRVDGGGRTSLSEGSNRDELQPALSPDEKIVAFVSEDAGLRRLFVRRVDGSGERMLVRDEVVARPIW